MNAEFQRIARRDKKAFLSDQCKEQRKIIEWERLDLFKKIRDTKGIFHAKMGTMKDRNSMATHSSVLAWRIPGMEEPGGLSPMGSHSWTRLK